MKALHHKLPSGRIVVDDAVLEGKIIAAVQYAHEVGEPVSVIQSPSRDKRLMHLLRLHRYGLANGVVSAGMKNILAQENPPITTEVKMVSNQRVWIGGNEKLVPETTYLSAALA